MLHLDHIGAVLTPTDTPEGIVACLPHPSLPRLLVVSKHGAVREVSAWDGAMASQGSVKPVLHDITIAGADVVYGSGHDPVLATTTQHGTVGVWDIVNQGHLETRSIKNLTDKLRANEVDKSWLTLPRPHARLHDKPTTHKPPPPTSTYACPTIPGPARLTPNRSA